MGGIYEVLELLYTKTEEDGLEFEFTKDDVIEITGLSKCAVTNNLNKLVKIGFLSVRFDLQDNRRSYYKLKGDMVAKFVIECLRG